MDKRYPIGLEHASKLREGLLQVMYMNEHIATPDKVEHGILIGQGLDISLLEGHKFVYPFCFGPGTCHLQVVLCDIYAHDVAAKLTAYPTLIDTQATTTIKSVMT